MSGDSRFVVYYRMEVKEIKNRRLHGINQHFAVESVVGLIEPIVYPAEIALTHKPLLRIKTHDRIEEERQLPFHTVVGLRDAEFDERGRHIERPHGEIFRRPDVVEQFSLADYHQVTFVKLETLSVKDKRTAPSQTQRMREIFLIPATPDTIKRLLDYDILHSFHVQK